MITYSNIVLVLAATTTALMAGLFYSWSCSVTIGIARLSDAEYLRAMQAMNEAILNPVFFAAFMGTLFLLPLSAYMQYEKPATVRFWYLALASVLYAVGVFGVTIFGNVPLNEALKSFDVNTAAVGEIAGQRLRFEVPWNRLNMVRTIISILAVIATIIACLSHPMANDPKEA